jgi:cytochrome c oxidase assembly factor CtaG
MQFFTRVEFEPGATVAIIAAAAWYLWAARRCHTSGRPWPVYRTASWLAALALMAAAFLSGLPAMDHDSFEAYGAQYIMVDLVAPVLLAFAAPLTLLVKAIPQPAADRLLRALEHKPGRQLVGPIALWLVFAASICVLFFTGLYGDTVSSGWVQQVVLLGFAAIGWLYWWPVVDLDPRPRRLGFWPRILYLLLAFPLFAVVGMGLESETTRIAPAVPLADLHAGGAVIWVVGESLILLAVVAVFVQWLRADERAAARRDQLTEEAAERQLALWRATRDAAARAASPR